VETTVSLPSEDRPHILPSSYARYYERVLAEARYSTNPYVTTVVLNPQHDQSELLHYGIAPIRGMLAAVDYGMHATIEFSYTYYDYYWDGEDWVAVPVQGTLDFVPWYESLIDGNRLDVIWSDGWTGAGKTRSGEFYLRFSGGTMYWQPYWFAGNPYVVWNDGDHLQLFARRAWVDTPALARTILHELGHTLGLCHAHEPECYRAFAPEDQFRTEDSTMSYESTALGLLPSE